MSGPLGKSRGGVVVVVVGGGGVQVLSLLVALHW